MEHLENEFTKRFKNKHLSSDGFDADGLWDDIANDLTDDPIAVVATTGLPWFKVASVIIGILLLALIGYFVATMGDTAITNDTLGNTDQAQINSSNTILNNQAIASTAEIDNSSIDSINTNNNTALNTINKEQPKKQSKTKLLSTTLNNNKNISSDHSEAEANATNSSIHKKSNTTQNKNVETSNNQSTITSLAIESNINIQTKENDTKGVQNKNPQINKAQNNTAQVTTSAAITSTAITTKPSEIVKQATYLTMDRLVMPTQSLDINESNPTLNMVNAPTYDLKDNTTELSLALNIFTGINSFTQQYNTLETIDIADQLNAAHGTYIGISSGAGLTATLDNKWTLSTGVEYNQLSNTFNKYNSNTISRIKDDVLLKVWIQESTGDTIAQQRGQVAVDLIQSRRVEHYNTYKRYSIPLEIGINRDYRKWGYAINTGIAFNFTTYQDGRSLDNIGTIVDFDTNNEIAPFRSFDIGFRVNASASYHITDKVSLTLSPQWMRVKGNNQRADISSTIQQFQLNIGASYRLR